MSDSKELTRVMYVSSANGIYTKEQLQEILTTSRKNNQAKNITGILLYSEGNIIQILEGERGSLELLFDKIVKDPRHRSVIKIQQKIIPHRNFADWSMAFKTLTSEEFSRLEGYWQLNDLSYIPQNIEKSIHLILTSFLENNR